MNLLKLSIVPMLATLMGCQSMQINQTQIDSNDVRTSLLQTDISIEHFKDSNLHDSMLAAQEALIKNPNNAVAWMMLGMNYQADGSADNLPKAKHAFEKAVKLDPNNPQIHNNYGQFLLKNRLLTQAVSEFRLAANVITYDSRESAYSNLGYTYLEMVKLGDNKAKILAKESFDKALSLSNNYEPALLGLTQLQSMR